MEQTMFGDYDKIVQLAMKKLDEYDFTDLLSDCYDDNRQDIYEIIDSMIDEYPELDEDESPLNDLSIYEIMDYLSKKYNIEFLEQTHYYMRYKRW